MITTIKATEVKIMDPKNRKYSLPYNGTLPEWFLMEVEKRIKTLRENGVTRRIGDDKGGYWEVIENGIEQ